jgi:hypothetical protein
MVTAVKNVDAFGNVRPSTQGEGEGQGTSLGISINEAVSNCSAWCECTF